MTQERLDFCDGKYTFINDNGVLTALRHGEPWCRDLVGDNLVYWMFVEVQRLKQLVHDREQECFNYSAGMNAQLRINANLQQHKEALAIWFEKTDWVQASPQPGELGMHRADALKARIERKNELLRQSLAALNLAYGYGTTLVDDSTSDAIAAIKKELGL